jgi:putative salt-induced outer membrane protein YdiY
MGKRKTQLIVLSIFLRSVVADENKLSDVEAQYTAKSTIEATEVLKQSIHVGISSTTGNTEILNINAKYTMSFATSGYETKALKIAFDASAFITENNNVRDNEEFTANLGLEQYIFDTWLGYASVNWLRNEFRNYDNKFSVGFGVGKEIFNNGQHSLKIKIGTAYNLEQFFNKQSKNDYASFNEYLEHNNKFNEVSSLYLKMGTSQNVDDSGDYEILAVAGLTFVIAENLSVCIEQEVRYDQIPPVGFDNTDTKSIVRVGYDF